MAREIRWLEADTQHAGLDMLTKRVCSEEERDMLLERLGLELGRRYPHAKCPIDPEHPSHGEPVVVEAEGIQCWSCTGRLGRGFVPYSRLLKGNVEGEVNHLKECAQHFCHYAHADYILGAMLPWYPEKLRRPLYSAMLKTLHPEPEDPRRDLVFRPFPFVRGEGGWCHADTLNITGTALDKAVLFLLPTTMFLEEGSDEGKRQSSKG